MERQTVSIMKACEMVGVSRRTIYNWIASGKVEHEEGIEQRRGSVALDDAVARMVRSMEANAAAE